MWLVILLGCHEHARTYTECKVYQQLQDGARPNALLAGQALPWLAQLGMKPTVRKVLMARLGS